MLMIVLSLIAYLIATILWFYGEAYFLKEMQSGNTKTALLFASLSFLAVPLFAFGTYFLYKHSSSWTTCQFPYWIMSIIISYLAFRTIILTEIGWRELVSAGLLVIIAFLLKS